MTDEWTMACKELPSGEMDMMDRLVHHAQLIFFKEQEVGPESKMVYQLMALKLL